MIAVIVVADKSDVLTPAEAVMFVAVIVTADTIGVLNPTVALISVAATVPVITDADDILTAVTADAVRGPLDDTDAAVTPS